MLRIFLLTAWLFSVAASPASDEARRLIAQNQDAAAFQRVESASRRGDDDATALLGWFYDTGRHVPRDYARAAELYRRVAADNPSVQWRLGVMYDLGQGVPENPQEAVRLFRQAAGDDDANANASLAVMYASGRGVDRDFAEAQRLYREAARLGEAHGFYGVAVLHALGQGVPRDDVEALAWALVAATLGDEQARRAAEAFRLPDEEMRRATARGNAILREFGYERHEIRFRNLDRERTEPSPDREA